MENLMMFEGNEVEVLEFNGKVLFNPKHVAEILGIKEIRSVIRNFNDKQVVKIKNSDVHSTHIRKLNNAGENFLTESGVYKLMFRSRKPEAERFTDWIADEVIPSIRKNEGYLLNQEEMSDTELLAKSALVAQKLIAEKQARIEELEPQAKNYKLLMDSQGNIDFAEFVKCAKLPEGRNTFMSRLRREKILMEKSTTPRQNYIEQGYFKVIQTVVNRHSTSKTVITKKGQDWLIKKCDKWNLLETAN